ncbi:MAG: apolipoprotein N-acyltransferase [Actinomycetota bacterium]|nr:apolipoprotein N-acyltransferase [Actinomycetota bacterium]
MSELTVLPLPAALALSALSGAALATAFPSLGWWPMAPLAAAGTALATRGRRPRTAFALGLLTGVVFFFPHLHWSGAFVGLLPWSALTLVEALYLAAMSAAFPLAWRAPGGRAGTVTTLTGLWVAQETLRGHIPFGGFPWGRVAFSQADAPTLGYAALGGAPLVTAAVAATGACLAVAVTALAEARTGPPTASRTSRLTTIARTTAPPLLVALVILGGGAAVPRPTLSDRTAAVAAVQGNVPRPGLDFNAERRAVLDNHAAGTIALADQVATGHARRPDVVLWPENSSDIDPLRNPDARSVITRATDAVGAPVLVGAILAEPLPKVSNAAILWGPTGSATPGPGPRYVKRHPAPFAEYVPFRSFFRLFSDKVDLVRAGFAAGRTVTVMRAGPARLGPVICFEVAYDDLVRDQVRAGADLIVVQTNNATFGFTDESVQQLAMSRLRAVETGRSVAHISTVGVSALITPDGHETTRSGHFTPQVLQATLPLRHQQTLAVRAGAAPELALGATGILLTAWTARRTRRRHGPIPTPDTPTTTDDRQDPPDPNREPEQEQQ